MSETSRSFALFMDGPACGRGRQVPGRPDVIRWNVHGVVTALYRKSCGYSERGLAVFFYREVKQK